MRLLRLVTQPVFRPTALRGVAVFTLLLLMSTVAAADRKAAPPVAIRGKVFWVGDAVQRLHGVRLPEDARERILVLETDNGELHPLMEDIRGRAFRRDERLRGISVELLVRRHPGTPLVQIIRVYALEGSRKFELDYWCEICAIAMFELKECDCCQGPIELRRRQQ